MLRIEVSRIPPEGIEIDDALTPDTLHLEGEAEFQLHDGGRLRCRVERGDDQSVHVRGRLDAGVNLECGRCLEAFGLDVPQELDLFYLPRSARPATAEQEDEVELSDHELVVAYYDDDTLDLGEMVREQIVLALPMKRLCDDACLGLCDRCGQNRNTGRCQCADEADVDPRLSALRDLLNRGSSS